MNNSILGYMCVAYAVLSCGGMAQSHGTGARTLVNIGSIMSLQAGPPAGAMCCRTAEDAIEVFGDELRKQLSWAGVRVVVVRLGQDNPGSEVAEEKEERWWWSEVLSEALDVWDVTRAIEA